MRLAGLDHAFERKQPGRRRPVHAEAHKRQQRIDAVPMVAVQLLEEAELLVPANVQLEPEPLLIDKKAQIEIGHLPAAAG